jgi:nitrite reductase/ring-hydroxylating ferredoxin subunit
MQYIDVCAAQEVAPGTGRAVRVGSRDVALFNVAGNIHAIDNACPHAGSALAGGKLCGRFVACPSHGWRFDVTTGKLAVAPEIGVACHRVRLEGERVLVALAA